MNRSSSLLWDVLTHHQLVRMGMDRMIPFALTCLGVSLTRSVVRLLWLLLRCLTHALLFSSAPLLNAELLVVTIHPLNIHHSLVYKLLATIE